MPGLRERNRFDPTEPCNANLEMDLVPDPYIQNLFVMIHGEQRDEVDSPTDAKASRPWESPLTENGKLQSWAVGRRLRLEEWEISRIMVSPSLRCVQTAAAVFAGLSPLVSGSHHGCDGRDDSTQPSKIKVSIEFGLADMKDAASVRESLNRGGKELQELFSLLPSGSCDTNLQQTMQKLPRRNECRHDARRRYSSAVHAAANNFSEENVLCITHGEGLRQILATTIPRVKIYDMTYCAFTHAQRPIYSHGLGADLIAGDWDLVTESGPSSGLFFLDSENCFL